MYGKESNMSGYTREDIIKMVRDEDVEFIRLQFTDIPGTFKNVAVTDSQLERRWITGAALMSGRQRDWQGPERALCICIRITIRL